MQPYFLSRRQLLKQSLIGIGGMVLPTGLSKIVLANEQEKFLGSNEEIIKALKRLEGFNDFKLKETLMEMDEKEIERFNHILWEQAKGLIYFKNGLQRFLATEYSKETSKEVLGAGYCEFKNNESAEKLSTILPIRFFEKLGENSEIFNFIYKNEVLFLLSSEQGLLQKPIREIYEKELNKNGVNYLHFAKSNLEFMEELERISEEYDLIKLNSHIEKYIKENKRPATELFPKEIEQESLTPPTSWHMFD